MTQTEPFEHAVTRHGPTVLRVCRAALGPGPDADDAWSETFLAALRSWPTLDPDVNLQAWLVRVAQRKAIDILRARQRHAVPVAEVPDAPSPRAEFDADHHDLWLAVAALPEKQRLAVSGHYFGGLTHSETATLTGSTPAAVRRAASDGLASLRANYRQSR